MVNRGVAETKDDPEYGLEGVRRIAGFKQVNYKGRRVQRHVANLGYSLDDVCDWICALQESDFDHSERYEGDGRWHDVYLLHHPVPADPRERLYIKFRVSRDCVFIELCSFHPEGWM